MKLLIKLEGDEKEPDKVECDGNTYEVLGLISLARNKLDKIEKQVYEKIVEECKK